MDDIKSMNPIANKSNKQLVETNAIICQQDDKVHPVKGKDEGNYDDWEDADFDDLDDMLSLHTQKGGIKWKKENNADGNNDDDCDWLSTRMPDKSPHGTKKPADGIYLTNQFIQLNTPASKKKKRCVECTRPLNDSLKLLCLQCSHLVSNENK
mmetsp:Transcript_20666/g.35511  ORF Transcript_20666/g.35511 Transcript_20666/m.35511 type:complete len:153 (+) Transcript_20666:11-469(+)